MSATIPSRANGATIDATWFNIIKSAVTDVTLDPSFVTATETLGANYNLAAVDASSGAVDLTLPSAINNEGRFYIVKAVDLTNAITVVPDGSETIDGAASYSLNAANDCARFDCDGSNWHVTSSYGSVVGREVKNCSVTTPSRLDVKQDTNANLVTYAASAANGQLCFATDTKKMYQVLEGALTELGSGGGAGDADTISLIRAGAMTNISEVDLTGNNAAFDGGGTITAGSLSLSTTAGDLILADKVIKYSPGANGQNDYFGLTVAIPQGLRGRTIGLSFEYKNGSTCADNDFSFNVKLKDGAQAGYTYSDLLVKQYNSTNESIPFEYGYYVPSDCTEIEFGWQNEVTTTTVELFLDNILVSSSPFVYKNMMVDQYVRYDAHAGFGSSATKIPYFTTASANIGTQLVSISNSATNGFSITALKKCKVAATYFSSGHISSSVYMGLSLNASSLTANIYSLASAEILAGNGRDGAGLLVISASATVVLNPGDIIRPHTEGDTPQNNLSSFTATIFAESEHVVTPAKSTLSDWTAYTPSFTGFGTVTNITGFYRQVGDSYEIQGSGTAGTLTAEEARISLPGSSTIDSTKNPSIRNVGTWTGGGTASIAGGVHVLAEAGAAYLTLGYSSAVAAPLTKANANVLHASNQTFSFNARVPITGLSGLAQLLAAIPSPKTCYLKDVKAYNVAGGSAVVGHQVRTLNTLEGDTSFCSLNGSNQFTLQSGTYDIEASAPLYHTAGIRTFIYLRDTSAGTNDAYEGKTANAYLAQPVEIRPELRMSFTLTAPKTFELKQYADNNPATTGLGVSHNLTGYNNVYATVRATKVK